MYDEKQSPQSITLKMLILFILMVIVGCLLSKLAGASILSVAQSQIGQGEVGGDNRGPVVKKYTKGQEVPWCAGFVSWVLKQAGKSTPYYLSARSYLKSGKIVANPKAGDLVIFSRGKGGHVGIVESVKAGQITTIEGNIGAYPAKVKRIVRKSMPNLLGFVRIEA